MLAIYFGIRNRPGVEYELLPLLENASARTQAERFMDIVSMKNNRKRPIQPDKKPYTLMTVFFC